MKNKLIRSKVAMMVIFFAVIATSCKKDSDITPTTPATPVIPPTPVTPAVSLKPVSIITTENGVTVRKQIYEYDALGKLTKYESTGAGISDSVLVFNNNITFKTPGSNNASQVLVFNPDKTFKALFSATTQIDFVNNETKLSRMTKAGPNNTTVGVGEFAYVGNNLSTLGAEIRIDISYHDNLPYQKGINEIPVAFKPFRYFKIMEMENATSTVLYNKLIRQVIITSGASRFETHDYTYTFDGNNRITQIRDTKTNVTSTTSEQRVFISTLLYAQN